MAEHAVQVFKGVRVLELAQFVFVPGAGAVLADLGAEVIKVETTEGDPYRRLRVGAGRTKGSVNLSMELNNRGKKSLAIDLKSKAGRDLLLRLVETADVFLTSIRPGALDRLGLSAEVLRARNPRLIHAHGNGLGLRGDQADRAGYDASCFWSRGGFGHILSRPGERPVLPRPALGDHAGSMNLAFGIAAALFHRERTGEAPAVEVSLLSSAMWILGADVTQTAAYTDEELAAMPAPKPGALTATYGTADGRYLQLMLLDPQRYWPGLCERIGREDLTGDPRFADNAARSQNSEALIAELSATFSAQPLDRWRAALAGWDAPWEVVQTIRELVEDPQAAANDLLYDLTSADGTSVRVVAGPVSFGGSPRPEHPVGAPATGADTRALLQGIGLSDAEIAGFENDGVIAAG
jgi:crotonobetainyl-CoA:carnitine CoA-transferase CaiB-like acyl-CoA transferase